MNFAFKREIFILKNANQINNTRLDLSEIISKCPNNRKMEIIINKKYHKS